uniref:Uncharacterized protein n=1 Tax=Arundo donax TaxID=35708 RepID=A0A0A8ZTQ0_ARUDO
MFVLFLVNEDIDKKLTPFSFMQTNIFLLFKAVIMLCYKAVYFSAILQSSVLS